MSETVAELATLSLREETPVSGPLRVDRSNNVIYGVKLLGDTSKNVHPVSGKPYKYTDNALTGFASLQEGARIFLDHKSDDGPRSYADQLGEFKNVKSLLSSKPRGNFGDFHYNPAHPLAEQMLHDAENAPHRLAMSHIAVGVGRVDGDWHLVEEAKSVESVDLVCKGATNVSLYESEQPANPVVQDTAEEDKEMDELREQIETLKAEKDGLERQLAMRECRDKREAAIKEADVKVSEKLMEHLLSVDDEAACVIIESLKAVTPVAQAPKARDINAPTSKETIESTEDFLNALGG